MKKLFKHLTAADVLNILNIPVAFMTVYLNKYFIILTAALFVSVAILAVIKKHREENASFFRYMWCFIASAFGYAADIKLLESKMSVLAASVAVAIVIIYFFTRNGKKSVAVLLLYALLLGNFFYTMTIATNRTFDKSEARHITAVVTDKSSLRYGKYLDIRSDDTVNGKPFGEGVIECTQSIFDKYDIGDEIAIAIGDGALGIKYYYEY